MLITSIIIRRIIRFYYAARKVFRIVLFLFAVSLCSRFATACSVVVPDSPENVQKMSIHVSEVCEGEDIPVQIQFDWAGLTVDNPGWGNPWDNATFYPELKDEYGRDVENAIWSAPDVGVISSGSRINMPENGKLNLVLNALRAGRYSLRINIETRYTVDTWVGGWINVKESSGPTNIVLVRDFTLPGNGDGATIDEGGNLVLDLRFFNDERPFVYESVVSPFDATNKDLVAVSDDLSIVDAAVRGGRVISLTPKAIGTSKVLVSSVDGNVKKSISVKVIETLPDAANYTLPTDSVDDGGDVMADFDVSGRLALDINNYPSGAFYEYICKPVPDGSVAPTLSAVSDTPSVADASIVNGNHLRIYPKNVGYANIKISKSDGSMERTLRVAVISSGKIILTVEEGNPSASDAEFGVFPCKVRFSSTTKYNPTAMNFTAYCKTIFRADLSDPRDNFVAEELKNARTAFAEYEEHVVVAFIPGVSAYDIYNRVMLKVAGTKYLVHHSDDFPNNRDYYLSAKMYKVVLQFSLRQSYDTNLYRMEIVEEYNKPENRLYQYL